MASAYRCDRCGNFNEGVPAFAAYIARCREINDIHRTHPGTLYQPDPNVASKPLELCADCGKRILQFLNQDVGEAGN